MCFDARESIMGNAPRKFRRAESRERSSHFVGTGGRGLVGGGPGQGGNATAGIVVVGVDLSSRRRGSVVG